MSIAILLLLCATGDEPAVTKELPAALAGFERAVITKKEAHKVRGSGGGPVCWGITAAGTDGAMLPICIRQPNPFGAVANGWVGGADRGIPGMHRNLPYRQSGPVAGADMGVSLR